MLLKTPVIFTLLVSSSVVACGSAPGGRSEGGMDGAGTLGLGLRLGSGIFTQAVWEDGSLAYVVLNDRDEDVRLTFSECTNVGELEGCTFGRTIVTWRLTGRSMRRITGADALAISSTGEMMGCAANGEKLGLLLPEVAPFTSESSVVSNADINSTGGGRENVGQVETGFLVAPGAAFTLDLSLPVTGRLQLSSKTDPVEGLPFLDVVDARSLDATVSVTDEGLSVDVPESASAESPVRVAVDVRYPEGFAGKLVGFDAPYCVEMARSGSCLKSLRIQRAIPAEAPLP
jgi:hypothetical protein